MTDDEMNELLDDADTWGAAEIVAEIDGQHYLISVMPLNTEETMRELGCKNKH
jgi:hypothetical protein